MEKKFAEARAMLESLQQCMGGISMVANNNSGVPGFLHLTTAFYPLLTRLCEQATKPIFEELENLYNNNGPLARHALMSARDAVLGSESFGTDFVDISKTLIEKNYPKFCSKDDQSLDVSKLLEGLVSTGIKEYTNDQNEQVLDIWDQDAAIALSATEEYWSQPKVIYNSGTDPIILLNSVAGLTKSKSVLLELTITWDNGSELKLSFMLSYSDESYSGRQLNVYRSMDTTKWMIPKLNYSQESKILDNIVGEVYNAYEDLTYPIQAEHISHALVKDMFKKLLISMGVDVDQTAYQEWADPKYVYKVTYDLLREFPISQASAQNLPLFRIKWSLESKYWTEYSYSDSTIHCEDSYLVAEREDCNYTSTDNEYITLGKVIEYYIPRTKHDRNGIRVSLVLNDAQETAQFFIYYDKKILEGKPSPRTVEFLIRSLKESRIGVAKENQKKVENEKPI